MTPPSAAAAIRQLNSIACLGGTAESNAPASSSSNDAAAGDAAGDAADAAADAAAGSSSDPEPTSAAQTKHRCSPVVLLFTCFFKGLSFASYLICPELLREELGHHLEYPVVFVIVSLLASFDFWMVKNVSGPRLCALRWHNVIDAEGRSHWYFESHAHRRKVNFIEAKLFWTTLLGTPLVSTFNGTATFGARL